MSATGTKLNQAYLDAINTAATRDDLPAASAADITLDADAAPADIAAVYKQWGCVMIRGLLADRVAEVLADTEEMARQVKASNYTRTGNALVMPGSKTGREKQIMLFCPTYTFASSHFQAATDTRVLDAVESMVGPNVEMFGTGMCMYKEPGGGMEKALHQDAPYFYHRDHKVVTGFMHLVDTTKENGCLHVAPGSWRLGLLPHVDEFSHLALPKDKWPTDCAVPLFAKAGDVVFFNYLTIHGSDNNLTDHVRPALCMQYRSADDDQIWAGAAHLEKLGEPFEDPHGRMLLRGRRIRF